MSTKKIINIAVISFVMLVLIFGAVFLLIKYKNDLEQNNTIAKYYYHDMGEMYCNLRNSNKIAKLSLTIEITNEKLSSQLASKDFFVRHEVNTIMVNKTEKDLEGKEGLIALQNEITKKLAELFNTKEIINIYFKEFIVQ